MTPPAPPSLSHKTAWNFASGVALIAGRFGAGLIVARVLGPEALGRTAYLLWLADIAATLTHLALPATLTRFLAERLGAGDVAQAGALRPWLRRRFLLGVALGAVGLGAALSATPASAPAAIIGITVVYFCAQSLWLIAQAGLAGEGRFLTSAKINVSASLVLLAGVMIGALTAGLPGALSGYLLGAIVAAAAGQGAVRAAPATASVHEEMRRAVWRFALPTWLALVLGALVWGRLELFFLERFRGPHEVAIFAVGLSFVTLATQGPVLLADALMPHFAGLSGAGQRAEIHATYARATRLIAALVFPLTLGGAAIMPVLLPALYGADFANAANVATVLIAGAAVQAGVVGGTMLYGLGKAYVIAAFGVLGAVCAIAAGLIVIPRSAAWGAAWARVAIQVSITFGGFWFVQARLGCPVPWSALLRAGLAALACAGVARGLITLWPHPLMLVLAIAAGAVVHATGLRVLHVLTTDDRARLLRVAANLPAPAARPSRALLQWLVP